MSCSLFIVEDDLGQLEMVSAKFVRAGYSVVSVHHPRQALEAASFRQFQVALLDASLPEMDGLELMHRLKRTQDGVQIVILSGYEYPIWRAKAEGAFTWLVKPCRLALLEATVQHAFERAADEIPGMQIVPAHDWPMPCRIIVATTAGRKG
jgi:DNA-binding NtrC family response regulator